MDSFFKIKQSGSTIKTEIIAGICTFAAMAYILFVNAEMFTTLNGVFGESVTYEGMYIATALGAICGTMLMGLLARLPLAQASGMGLNAFAVFTICLGFGFTYANAMAMVLIDGIVFVILTLTGLRKGILNSIPKAVKTSIAAGIGLFIAYIGLQGAGIVVNDDSTLTNLVSLNVLNGSASWASIMPIIIVFVTIAIVAVFQFKKIRGGVLWGMLIGAGAYYLLGLTVPGFYDSFTFSTMNIGDAFNTWANDQFLTVFRSGFDFSGFIAANGVFNFVIVLITSVLAFCLVDMFDTLGTLYASCDRGNLLTADGEVPNMEKAMLSDAIATCAGAAFGTSTVTTFVESSAGTAEGGKTGLTAVTTAIFFAIAMILVPVASIIPSVATNAILIYVGALMLASVRNIDWKNMSHVVPAFITIALMPLTYNISYGIAGGIISYILIRIFSGSIKKIKVGTWVIGALFVIMLLLSH